jgi:tetratricopeptide (TPR) repeat protein
MPFANFDRAISIFHGIDTDRTLSGQTLGFDRFCAASNRANVAIVCLPAAAQMEAMLARQDRGDLTSTRIAVTGHPWGQRNLAPIESLFRLLGSLPGASTLLTKQIDALAGLSPEAACEFIQQSTYPDPFAGMVSGDLQIENYSFARTLLHQLSQALKNLITWSAPKVTGSLEIHLVQVQWFDPASISVLSMLLKSFRQIPATLYIYLDESGAKPAFVTLLKALVDAERAVRYQFSGWALEHSVEQRDFALLKRLGCRTVERHEKAIEQIMKWLAPETRRIAGLLAFAGEDVPAARLMSALQMLARKLGPCDRSLLCSRFTGETRLVLTPIWVRTIRSALADSAKFFYEALAEAALPVFDRKGIAVQSSHYLRQAGICSWNEDQCHRLAWHLHEKFGDLSGALAFYDWCEASHPQGRNWASLAVRRAYLYIASATPELAIRQFDVALEREPRPFQQVLLRCKYSVTVCKQKNTRLASDILESAKEFSHAIVEGPEKDYAEARLLTARAFLCYKLGEFEKAVAHLAHSAIFLQSILVPALSSYTYFVEKNMARVFLAQGADPNRVLAAQQRAWRVVEAEESQASNRVPALLALGSAHLATGNTTQAEAAFSHTLDDECGFLRPPLPELCEHISVLYGKAGKLSLMEAWLDRMMQAGRCGANCDDPLAALLRIISRFYKSNLYEAVQIVCEKGLSWLERDHSLLNAVQAWAKIYTYQALLAAEQHDSERAITQIGCAISVLRRNHMQVPADLLALASQITLSGNLGKRQRAVKPNIGN